MLGHAMYLASGRASKKEIDEFYYSMGWSKRRRRRAKSVKKQREKQRATR